MTDLLKLKACADQFWNVWDLNLYIVGYRSPDYLRCQIINRYYAGNKILGLCPTSLYRMVGYIMDYAGVEYPCILHIL